MPPAAKTKDDNFFTLYAELYHKYTEIYGAKTGIFIQVGSFYEMYETNGPLSVCHKSSFETNGPEPEPGRESDTQETTDWCNVREISSICDLQLNMKAGKGPNGLTAGIAGFPDHSLPKYAAKLSAENWTLIILDQVKDRRGKVIDHQVVRIISPGTYLESATPDLPQFIATVLLDTAKWGGSIAATPPTFSVACVDLTTGDTVMTSGNARGSYANWSCDELLHFFQIYYPREVLVLWRGDSLLMPKEELFRRLLGIPIQPIHCRLQCLTTISHLVQEDQLKRWFKPESMMPIKQYLGLGLEQEPTALCSLLQFIEDHFPSTTPPTLNKPTHWHSTKSLKCGNNALVQLNYISNLSGSGQDQQQSVLSLFQRCWTPMGRRALRPRLLAPLADAAAIEARLNAVSWAEEAQIKIRPILKSMFDLPRLHRKFQNAEPTAQDCLGLYYTYIAAEKLWEIANQTKSPIMGPNLSVITDLKNSFLTYFSKEKAEQSENNTASNDISFLENPQLAVIDSPGSQSSYTNFAARAVKVEQSQSSYINFAARAVKVEQQIQELYEEVRHWTETLCKSTGSTPDTLRIETRGEQNGITIRGPKIAVNNIFVKAAKLGNPYNGISKKETKSVGNYIESPFLNEKNVELLALRENLAEAVAIALPLACQQFCSEKEIVWQTLETWIEEIDLACCFAQVASERGFVRPTITGGGDGDGSSSSSKIKIENLRHPLIESIKTRSQYITHNVELSDSSWLIYGMNASGKSSLMKAIGIAVLLAQCGSFVPATSMTITPFKCLMTRILNTDNLWAGLSSFAVEVSELRDIFSRADNQTLVLGDELCSGTESVSATALVAAGIKWLLNRNTRFVFATHLHDLMKIPSITQATQLKIFHLRVRAEKDRLIYERTLEPGPGSSRYGLEVAKALDLPFELLEDAHKYRRALLGETDHAEGSAWNSAIVALSCEVCGSAIRRDLEVHHIRPREEAEAKRFANGLARDAVRNLAVVCQHCHDLHHAGKLTIGPVVDTSAGSVRTIEDDSQNSIAEPNSHREAIQSESKSNNSKWSSEEHAIIREMMIFYPKMMPKMLMAKLLNEKGISISEGTLRKMRASSSPN